MARSLYLLVYDSLPTYVCSDGLHYFNGHGSCDALCKHVNTSARFLKKKKINTYSGALQFEQSSNNGTRALESPVNRGKEKKIRTLVVDGVPKSEDSQHGDDDGRRRGILAVEEARLDAAPSCLRRRALRELGVERDEGAQVGALTRSLQNELINNE